MSPTASEVEIVRGLPRGAERAAAELYWEAFVSNIELALGPRDRGVAFIEAHVDHDRAVVAMSGDQFAGLAGFRHAGRPFVGGGAGDVLATYGRVRGLLRVALLAVLSRRLPPTRC